MTSHSYESATDTAESTTGGSTGMQPSRPKWYQDRRRRFFVPGSYQRRAILKVAALCFVLLIALDFALYGVILGQTEDALRAAPELSFLFKAQDQFQMFLIVIASFVALAGIVASTLFDTHRTAGAVYNLSRCMDKLWQEGLSIRVRFRKGDHFPEAALAFNRMADALESRARAWSRDTARAAAALRDAAEAFDERGEGAMATRLTLLAEGLEQSSRTAAGMAEPRMAEAMKPLLQIPGY